jgi:prophage maintenance system killer protein
MEMQVKYIWKPIEFNLGWDRTDTARFDILYPSWGRRRAALGKEPGQYERFIEQLKRKQAIDTGIIEQMYDLKRGITETFIREGFVASYLQHGDTDIAPDLLMDFLRDNFDAIDFIFDFVKNDRALSVSYIKELHHLITQHQETTDAIDAMGHHVKIALLKGQFKQNSNNPVRDGTVYSYCPPEQVESEMDNLVDIFNSKLENSHVLVKAAFLHHAFVQIHPFQDGNGRIARLLTSFVLIREGLFPFSIDRSDRTRYIDSLESADAGEYQPLVDIVASDQVASISRALSWRIVSDADGYDGVLQVFGEKLLDYRQAEAEGRNQRIRDNMAIVFSVLRDQMELIKDDLMAKLRKQVNIDSQYCVAGESEDHYYINQIKEYAKQHDYYANLSLGKCWGSFRLGIDRNRIYRMVVSLHHAGYDHSAFAIGAFLSKAVFEPLGTDEKSQEWMDVPLAIPPLTMSSEKEASQLDASISQHIESLVTAVLACIANEIG